MASRNPQLILRSARVLRQGRPVRRLNARFESTSAPQQASSSASTPLAAGIAGGSLVFLAGYTWYHFSGAKTLVNAAHQTKSTFDAAFRKSTENAPKPSEAIQWLRETVQGYTKIIPGSQGYVDAAFKDLETINEQHGPEVEKIIKETYEDLKNVTKAGASFAAATQAWEVLQKALSKIGALAKDAGHEIMENHPQLKEKFGGKLDQLKQMGEQYGPEAKKQVDETWNQVQDIVKQGPLNPDSLKKVQDLVQEKFEAVKKYGDQAWQKGMEEAKPALEKNPKVKEFVEKNKDSLMQGNVGQLWNKIKGLAEKGDSDEIMKSMQQQVDSVKDKAQESGVPTSFLKLFDKIPGAGELEDKLKQLQELYHKRGQDAEELVKSAVEEIKQVLSQKVKEGEKLKDKAEQDVKRS